MNSYPTKQTLLIGFALAFLTVVIWSGNYVVAKGISEKIPPISLAFCRWGMAFLFIIPLGIKKFIAEKHIIVQHKKYLFITALFGVSLFNTFIYLAGHHTSAINLALIGTTASPIFITILSLIFLQDKISSVRIIGILFCIAGILLLLSHGSLQQLLQLHFGKGDLLMLCSSFAFSIYSILVRQKPANISPISFLFVLFITGTILLLPFAIIELQFYPPLHFTTGMYETIIYLGLGNSVIGFLCWNGAIAKIGPARTSLFGNLIPVFSTIEAVIFLNESFTTVHLISGCAVIIGLIIANLKHS